MIVDTSAVIAVIAMEPGYEALAKKLSDADILAIGTPTLTECGIVLSARFGALGRTLLNEFLEQFPVVEVPFTEAHWRTAVTAFERFGKGRHPAGLNYGDCMSYAVARLAGRPLLCIGNDFVRTDLQIA
ncbi:MAG TPA: type II toxin-antitoxin system VapC family toxin [Longimicrobium sp.]